MQQNPLKSLLAMQILGLPPEELKQAFQGPDPASASEKLQLESPNFKLTVYYSILTQLIFRSVAHGNFLLISGRYNLKIVCSSFLFLSFLVNILSSMENVQDPEVCHRRNPRVDYYRLHRAKA